MYFDEIDMLEDLPKFEDIKAVVFSDDYFSLELYTGEVKNLFMVVESLTRGEFEKIAIYLLKRSKELHHCEDIV